MSDVDYSLLIALRDFIRPAVYEVARPPRLRIFLGAKHSESDGAF